MARNKWKASDNEIESKASFLFSFLLLKMKINTKKALTLLEALLLGIDAKIDGATYGIVRGRLYLKMPFGDSQQQYFSRDRIPFRKFIWLADKLSDDQMKILQGSITIHKVMFSE